MPDISSRTYRLALVLVLLLAVVLGTAFISTPPVWLDEASSWYNSTGGWAHLWQRAVRGEDSGGFLYAALLKVWIAIAGDGEAALRIPGIALWLAAIGAVARAVRLAWRRDAAALAAAVALVHPSMLAAARQARGYILLLFLAALALLALAELAGGSRRRGAWLLAAASLGAAATHVMGVFVAIGAASAAVLIEAPRGWRPALRAGLLAAAPALAFAASWTALIRERVERNLASFWIPGTAASNYLSIAALLVAPLAAACAWLLWRDRTPQARRLALVLSVLAVPVAAGPGLVSALASPDAHLVLVRYALALVPIGAAAAGCALAALPRRLVVPLMIVAFAGSVAYSSSKNVYAPVTRTGQEIRGAAAWLRARSRAGDLLFVEPSNNWMALAYYGVRTEPVEGEDERWRVLSRDEALLPPKMQGSGASSQEAAAMLRPDIQGSGAGSQSRVEAPPLPGTGTVWLVRFSRRTSAPPDLLERASLAGRFGTIAVLRVVPHFGQQPAR